MPPNITAGFNISSTGLSIEWSHIPLDFIHGNLLGYIILYKMSSEPDSTSVPIDIGPEDLSKNITGLLIYTEYCVRLAGKTRIGAGNWSDCLNITTDEDVPTSPPLDFTLIEDTAPDTINLTWNLPTELNGELTGYKIVINTTFKNGTIGTREFMTCNNHISLPGIAKDVEHKIKVAASTRKGLGPFSECIEYGVLCDCPEYLQVVAKESTLDEHQGEGSLTALIEELIIEACGPCEHYEPDGKTKINRTISSDDADIEFPIIKTLHKIPPATSESSFVTVIEVPGLVVLQRKTEKESGFYEKVMGTSVVTSWPIFAIFGVMTLAAGMVIWVLDVNTNPEEFPPTFYKGAGEGLWWAFITMTTLG
ncbi:receptor-type tyrosine-protein phosphatase F-like [Oculina patagonica]